jgi:NAD(P)-dependent dehydrogenase (short-subunit alcohol dehydrogenase family)
MIADKVCVITGVGSGIGKSIAEVFARYGATVVGCDCNDISGQEVIGAIAAQGAKSQFICCDITCEDQVREMTEKVVGVWRRIDVLVNNAGINFAKPFLETTVEEWDRVINTDLRGTYLCCRAMIPQMLKSGEGSIVTLELCTPSLACQAPLLMMRPSGVSSDSPKHWPWNLQTDVFALTC